MKLDTVREVIDEMRFPPDVTVTITKNTFNDNYTGTTVTYVLLVQKNVKNLWTEGKTTQLNNTTILPDFGDYDGDVHRRIAEYIHGQVITLAITETSEWLRYRDRAITSEGYAK
jgi:hypothetical protein